MNEKSSLRYVLGGFAAGYILGMIGITLEDLRHSIPLGWTLSEWHHYINPLFPGCLFAFVAFILWKRKKAQLDTLKSYSRNLHALLDVNSTLISSIDLDSVLQIIVDESTHLANLDTGAIYLHEDEKLYLGATTPALPPDFPEILRTDLLINHPHIQRSLNEKQPVVLPDTSKAILSEAELKVVQFRGLRSVIYIPLIIENRPVGTLILGTVGRHHTFTENEINTYQTFSGQAALAIENARLFKNSTLIAEELKHQNENFTLLNEELIESYEKIKKVNEELLISKEKAEESDRLKSAFLANMSHEIRTPLNSILGFSDLLADTATDTNQRQKFNHIIQENGDQLLRIISDILDLSRIETGQIEIFISQFEPHKLIGDIVEELAHQAKTKKIDFHQDFDPLSSGLKISSDINKVKQILTNLVSNAIKFTEEGSIIIGYRSTENFGEFYVTDTGIGISEDNLDKIFKRFHRIEGVSKRKTEGNGLGLAISKSLVEKLGGKIWVESIVGKGSTFYFAIPN